MDRLLEATARAEDRHFWFRGFRRMVRPFIAQAVAHVCRPRLLDCGCGTGGNLRLLGDFGDATGFDLTWSGLAIARARGERRVVRASVDSVPFSDATFDGVTSFDVLYCLEAGLERRAVAEMWRVLKPGGGLVVNVAAMPILHGDHSIVSAEVRRYTRQGLQGVLEEAGFAIERLTYTNAALFPLLLAVRTWQRVTGLSPADEALAEITVPLEPVNALLSGALWAESKVLRIASLPFGSSLLCLARKPA
ncbi:MAG: class I SAM-dependent methyltransferase [Acidobacteriota bacterium]